jgi:hypothetical protein
MNPPRGFLIPGISQNDGNAGARLAVCVSTPDIEAARRYLAGLEAMAREARTSSDPRVLICALRVARQGKIVSELAGRGVA